LLTFVCCVHTKEPEQDGKLERERATGLSDRWTDVGAFATDNVTPHQSRLSSTP